jgi:hypothetical protein
MKKISLHLTIQISFSSGHKVRPINEPDGNSTLSKRETCNGGFCKYTHTQYLLAKNN